MVGLMGELIKYNQHDFDLRNRKSGKLKTTCPFCSHDRGNPKDRSVSIDIDKGVFYCHHCNETGQLHEYSSNGSATKPLTLHEFFERRGISPDTLKSMEITLADEWIKFPFKKDGEHVNTKSRSFDKKFRLETGKELIPYNIDTLKNSTELIITEGEIDVLTFLECGFKNVISVPNGANTNLDYLKQFDFSAILKIYVATDSDKKGIILGNALYDYFGMDRCVTVQYMGCKDVNELLCIHGKQSVKDAIKAATNPKFEKLLKRINDRHFTSKTQFEAEEPLLYIGGKKAMSLGNFSVISGKQKSGKGFSLSLLVNGFLNGHPQVAPVASATVVRKRVVHIDNEQAGGHAQRLVRTVGKLGGNEDLIDGYWLRGFSPPDIIQSVDQLIKKYSDQACLFIIDGVRDLSSKGVNDQEESTMIFVKLLDWTQRYNIHIIVVIHQNKNDDNATGFLGGDMVKKGELTLSVSKDKKTLTHKINPEDTRDMPLDPIFFQIDDTGTPIIIDEPISKSKSTDPQNILLETHKDKITEIFKGGMGLTSAELISKIKYHYKIGESKAKIYREFMIDVDLLKDTGNGGKRHYILVEENKLLKIDGVGRVFSPT